MSGNNNCTGLDFKEPSMKTFRNPHIDSANCSNFNVERKRGMLINISMRVLEVTLQHRFSQRYRFFIGAIVPYIHLVPISIQRIVSGRELFK